jgi:hypothetical protein
MAYCALTDTEVDAMGGTEADGPAPETDEIDVTPEMIDAGVESSRGSMRL